MRGVGILPAHQLRPCLNHSHFTAEAAIGLRQFEACISAADHDQMRRQDVELESFDMGHRVSGLEFRNVRNCCVRAHIQKHLGPCGNLSRYPYLGYSTNALYITNPGHPGKWTEANLPIHPIDYLDSAIIAV